MCQYDAVILIAIQIFCHILILLPLVGPVEIAEQSDVFKTRIDS